MSNGRQCKRGSVKTNKLMRTIAIMLTGAANMEKPIFAVSSSVRHMTRLTF